MTQLVCKGSRATSSLTCYPTPRTEGLRPQIISSVDFNFASVFQRGLTPYEFDLQCNGDESHLNNCPKESGQLCSDMTEFGVGIRCPLNGERENYIKVQNLCFWWVQSLNVGRSVLLVISVWKMGSSLRVLVALRSALTASGGWCAITNSRMWMQLLLVGSSDLTVRCETGEEKKERFHDGCVLKQLICRRCSSSNHVWEKCREDLRTG